MKSEDKILAGVCHLGILLHITGIVLTLVIYLLQKDKSTFVADHAKQALGDQIAVALLSFFVSFAGVGGALGSFLMRGSLAPIGFLGGLISLAYLVLVAYAVYAAYNAFTGKDFQYAMIGDFIAKI